MTAFIAIAFWFSYCIICLCAITTILMYIDYVRNRMQQRINTKAISRLQQSRSEELDRRASDRQDLQDNTKATEENTEAMQQHNDTSS